MKARKIIIAAAAGTALAAAMLALGTSRASASLGTPLYASCSSNDGGACAGLVTTGQNFKTVTASAFTRDPDQYAAISPGGVGWQVGLKDTADATTLDAIIGISDVPGSGAGYSPSAILYKNGTLVGGAQIPNEFWCPANGTCAPAQQGGAFPVGQDVTLSVYYNRGAGVVNFGAYDSAGDFFTGWERVGHAAHFGQARVEAGFDQPDFTAPDVTTKLAGFSGVGFTSYAGVHLNLRSATVVRQQELATSDGTSAGTVQAGPGTVNTAGTGFPVNFLP